MFLMFFTRLWVEKRSGSEGEVVLLKGCCGGGVGESKSEGVMLVLKGDVH